MELRGGGKEGRKGGQERTGGEDRRRGGDGDEDRDAMVMRRGLKQGQGNRQRSRRVRTEEGSAEMGIRTETVMKLEHGDETYQ
eukprot:763929-Hanusia_phi.AAC.13